MRVANSRPLAVGRPGLPSIAAILVLGLLLLSGCGQKQDIRQYAIPKEPSVGANVTPPAGMDAAWFFKMMGPQEKILEHSRPFVDIIRSAEFREGVPQYVVPDGWKITPGPAPRHETVTIPGSDPPIEITVSSLPAPRAGFDDFLQANVNRWRQQVGLEALEADDWRERAEQAREIMSVPLEDRTITMVNLSGTTETYGGTGMLVAIVTRRSGSAAPDQPPASPSPESPLSYEAPEGWEESAGSSMRLASFRIPGDAGAADLSVTRFPGGGGVLANVNRWRSQIDLETIDENELAETMEEIDVSGRPGTLVMLEGEEQAILAVIVEEGDAKWFFKMQGPTETVSGENENFRAFLGSVKIGP